MSAAALSCAHPRAAAVRRAHRRGRLDGVRDPRLPLATGIWAEVDPFEVASIQAFRRDPARVWGFYRERLDVLRDAQPNAAHLALAELERRGLVSAVVTQNIDMLHTRAGSRDVVEVHGSIALGACLGCLWTERVDAVARAARGGPAPGVPAMRRRAEAGRRPLRRATARGARSSARPSSPAARALMLVVGSSLEVWPVAGLPLEAQARSRS